MDVYTFDLKSKKHQEDFEEKTTLLIGEFDVFHVGHNELLNIANSLSTNNKLGITIFDIEDKINIIPLNNRLQNIANIGFNFVILIKFNFEFKKIMANDFLDYVVKKYNVENIIVGEDFRFGNNRMWGVNELKSYFKKTFVSSTKKINNIKISSSEIAEMIKTGEIGLVNELLLTKYNPTIEYKLQKVIWDERYTKPHNGIYYIKVNIHNYWYHGLLHISMKHENTIELLNYHEDLLDGYYEMLIIEESRIIINSRMDSIIDKDKKNCIEFFYILQLNNI